MFNIKFAQETKTSVNKILKQNPMEDKFREILFVTPKIKFGELNFNKNSRDP